MLIFTNDIEKLVSNKDGFYFGNDYTVLVPYNEYGKFLIRNNSEIRKSIYERLNELYGVELSDLKFADVKVNEDNYITIMPLIDMEKLTMLKYYYTHNMEEHKIIHIFGLEEYEEVIKNYLPICDYKSLTKEKINQLLEEYKNNN